MIINFRYVCFIFLFVGSNFFDIVEGSKDALNRGIELFNSGSYESAKVVIGPLAKKKDPIASYMMGIISLKKHDQENAAGLNSTLKSPRHNYMFSTIDCTTYSPTNKCHWFTLIEIGHVSQCFPEIRRSVFQTR